MSTPQDSELAPTIRFKRRKTAHQKRVYADDEVPIISETQAPGVEAPIGTAPPPDDPRDDERSVPNLKEIIRARKRPRDRLKDVVRKAEAPKAETVAIEDTPREDARLAEQNYRQYGWPISSHLQAAVAEIAPDLQQTWTQPASAPKPAIAPQTPADIEKSIRMAAGNGKIEEVEIVPIAKRTDEKWRRLGNGDFESLTTGKVRTGRDGKPRRPAKRRNSDDVRRDQMVEAVLSEAKLDYFDASTPSNPRFGAANNDEAILQQFQAEYYESIEEAQRNQRRPAATSSVKGADPPKGPKLGGSKSIRAKMRLAQEQAAKAKR
ncbi:hypothetical protein CC86DRAFT_396390 [Ophiobolus disseminans]|uniref:Hepatocellular carcinoma-associated antigen 59-domain-containing protein n=1 Tax=Ophiobolus disseminans TaxID=1469910 RepID=A0A6A6ZPT3_9PLEO|nr:hypothetical protein CC86DRAFT_396390 [Ophiobolus disseminans]